MLKIRFVRVGKKNKPFFRIAVGDSRRTPKGKFIEKLGYYNPLKKEKSINKERVLHWISNGAQCSDTVHNLLVSLEIIRGPKRKIKIKVKKSTDDKVDDKATTEKKSDDDKAVADKKSTDDKVAADKPASAEAMADKESADDKVVADKRKEEDKEEPKEKEKKEEVKENI